MKVVLFSGGTGSRAIQKGLHQIYKDRLDLKIIVNAYDNGLSTGAVRKMVDGKILGPSDLRKNQFLQMELIQKPLVDESVIEFLETRFDAPSAKVALEFVQRGLEKILDFRVNQDSTVQDAILDFFKSDVAELIDYTDFSVSNILYGALAKQFGNSLQSAGEWMAEQILGIPKDRVFLVSDQSLFLMANTESGKSITDEGDLVQWSQPGDKIIGIYLTDPEGNRVTPEVNEQTLEAIEEADMIIFSSGTQWSSLIPTYLHSGFNEAITESRAKKYLIMNNIEDKDMSGVSGDEMLDIIEKYLDLSDINIVVNEKALDKSLSTISRKHLRGNFLHVENDTLLKTHSPLKLVKFIFRDYFKDLLNPRKIIIDFDDTIHGRNNSFREESSDNIKLLLSKELRDKTRIVSGNSIKHFNLMLTDKTHNPLIFFCEGGNTMCSYVNKEEKIINIEKFISNRFIWTREEFVNLTQILKTLNIPIFKLDNRNNIVFTIKPLSSFERERVLDSLKQILGNEFIVRIAGKTSIDIYKAGYSKAVIFDEIGYPDRGSYYVAIGDEFFEGGNDSCFKGIEGIRSYPVSNPRDTNIYLTTLANEYTK